jgi:hypothetical protein
MSREQLLMQSDQDILTLQAEIDQVSKLTSMSSSPSASGLKLENQNILPA